MAKITLVFSPAKDVFKSVMSIFFCSVSRKYHFIFLAGENTSDLIILATSVCVCTVYIYYVYRI